MSNKPTHFKTAADLEKEGFKGKEPEFTEEELGRMSDIIEAHVSPGCYETKTPEVRGDSAFEETMEYLKGAKASETILEEAERITHGTRNSDYGPPEENHQRTADFWCAYLGVPVTRDDVCMMNALQKISRGRNLITRDTAVDVAGYMRNIEMMGGLE